MILLIKICFIIIPNGQNKKLEHDYQFMKKLIRKKILNECVCSPIEIIISHCLSIKTEQSK